MARPIIGLEEFIHVHTYNFTSPQIGDSAREIPSFVCFGFHDFVTTLLVSRFPFDSVYFLLLTGLSLKFIVVDLVPVLIFFSYFPRKARLIGWQSRRPARIVEEQSCRLAFSACCQLGSRVNACKWRLGPDPILVSMFSSCDFDPVSLLDHFLPDLKASFSLLCVLAWFSPPSDVLSLALCEVLFYFFFESLNWHYFLAKKSCRSAISASYSTGQSCRSTLLLAQKSLRSQG